MSAWRRAFRDSRFMALVGFTIFCVGLLVYLGFKGADCRQDCSPVYGKVRVGECYCDTRWVKP